MSAKAPPTPQKDNGDRFPGLRCESIHSIQCDPYNVYHLVGSEQGLKVLTAPMKTARAGKGGSGLGEGTETTSVSGQFWRETCWPRSPAALTHLLVSSYLKEKTVGGAGPAPRRSARRMLTRTQRVCTGRSLKQTASCYRPPRAADQSLHPQAPGFWLPCPSTHRGHGSVTHSVLARWVVF